MHRRKPLSPVPPGTLSGGLAVDPEAAKPRIGITAYGAEELIEKPDVNVAEIRDRIRGKRGLFKTYGADYLAYTIIDAVIDRYFPVLEEMGERLEALEVEIIERPQSVTLQRAQEAKRDMLAVRRSIWPQRRYVLVRQTTVFPD